MELVIKDIQSKQDLKLFVELAKRLGLKTSTLSGKDEDVALGNAINKARSSGYVSEKKIMDKLRNIGNAK